MKTIEKPSMRPLQIGAVVVAVVIAVVAILAATRGVTRYEEGTPEGTAQAYVTAILDKDHATARSLLSEELRQSCTLTNFKEAWVPERVRVTLRDVTTDADRAIVELRIIEADSNPPFDEFINEIPLVMRPSEDGWVIVEAPWPIQWCEPGR